MIGILLVPLVPHPTTVPSSESVSDTPRIVAARPTFTPSATPTIVVVTSATSTATSFPTASVFNIPAKTTTGAGVSTPTSAPPTATAKPPIEPARLVSPKDQTEFGGEDAEIILQWEGTLLEGQQFAATVRYIGKSDETKTVGSWLRESRWRVPNTILRDISLTLRALKWDVSIVDANGNAISAPSESRIFYWR